MKSKRRNKSSAQYTAYFNSPLALDTFQDDTGLVKKALVAVEGTFEDSQGNPHTFSPDRLELIAERTNAALETGNILPVCEDHNKTVGATVGVVEGTAYSKPIEITDLPNPKSTHLLGKMGLFLDDVTIKAKDAIDKISSGIVSSVSMGLNLDDNRIMELSLVPIPAIPNMGLFKHKSASIASFGDVDMEKNSFTWEDLENSSLVMEELKTEVEDLNSQLWRLLENIYTNDALPINDVSVLKQYVVNALNGYSLRVLDLLGLNDAPDTSYMNQDTGAMDADAMMQQQTMQRQDIAQPSMNYAPYSYSKGLINFRDYSKPYLQLRG